MVEKREDAIGQVIWEKEKVRVCGRSLRSGTKSPELTTGHMLVTISSSRLSDQ